MDQRLAGLEPYARQPRLGMLAVEQANTKTRERTEGAAPAVQAMHGDSCSANRGDSDSTCSISFGDDFTGPPAPPYSGKNALVNNVAAAPKLRPPLKMRSPSAAGGLLPTDVTSKITCNQPPLWLYLTEKTNLKTLAPYVSYESSFFHKSNISAAPSCRRVIETKSGENRMFDPGSAPARFWDRGARCFVERFMLGLDGAAAFFGGSMTEASACRRIVPVNYLRRTYSGQFAGSSKLGRL